MIKINSDLQFARPYVQLLIVFLMALAFWLAFQVIGFAGGMLFWDLGTQQVADVLENPSNHPDFIGFIRFLAGVVSFGMFVLGSFVAASLIHPNPLDFLNLRTSPALSLAALVVLLSISLIPVSNFFGYINSQIAFPDFMSSLYQKMSQQEEAINQLMETMLSGKGLSLLIANLIVIAILPAVGEELLFRGLVQKLLFNWTKSAFTSIAITALLFGVMHFQFLSLFPRILLGAVLGYIYHITANLYYPILFHFTNNALAVIYYHFFYDTSREFIPDDFGTPGNTILASIAGMCLTVAVLLLINKKLKSTDIKTGSPGEVDA